jgi:hypothetical protein
MKLMPTPERASLVLLILYCLDLTWKLAFWSRLTQGLSLWMVAGALIVRFAVMGGLLVMYLRFRKSTKNRPPNSA